jgi:hypothetical protein
MEARRREPPLASLGCWSCRRYVREGQFSDGTGAPAPVGGPAGIPVHANATVARDEIQASAGARSAPASLLHPLETRQPRRRYRVPSRCPRLTASCRTTMGAAERASDLSRVRQDGPRPDPLTCAVCGGDANSEGTSRRTSQRFWSQLGPGTPVPRAKCLLIATFLDGRGWFRTTVLSRVKHGVRGAIELGNACKHASSIRLAGE